MALKQLLQKELENELVPSFFEKNSLSYLIGQSDYWLESQGRLTEPMFKPKDQDHYQTISWEDAFKSSDSACLL